MVLAFHANFQSVAKRRNCLALSKIGLPISIFGYQDLQNSYSECRKKFEIEIACGVLQVLDYHDLDYRDPCNTLSCYLDEILH